MASLDDILTTAKNIVTAINGLGQTYLKVQGTNSAQAITVPTVISSQAGRLAWIDVTTAGTAPGTIYDSASLTMLTRPIHIIENTLGTEVVPLPVAYGLVVVPGTGQVVTVSYS